MLTPEQLEERRTGIGGSDVAAIAGISNFNKSPLDVYLEKIGEKSGFEGNDYTDWGNRLEPVVAERYAEITGKKIYKPSLFRHPEHKFMLANMDFLIEGENAAIECKTTSAYQASKWGEPGTDEVPTDCLMQVAHYRYAKNLDYIDIPVLIGGNDFRVYRYEKNTRLEEQVLNLEFNFWYNHVEKRIPPQPGELDKAIKLWPKAQDEKVAVASEEVIDAIRLYNSTKNSIKELEEKEQKYKEEICRVLQNAAILIDSEGSQIATWKNQETLRLDQTTLKKEYPQIYKTLCKPSVSRFLRIKGI